MIKITKTSNQISLYRNVTEEQKLDSGLVGVSLAKKLRTSKVHNSYNIPDSKLDDFTRKFFWQSLTTQVKM